MQVRLVSTPPEATSGTGQYTDRLADALAGIITVDRAFVPTDSMDPRPFVRTALSAPRQTDVVHVQFDYVVFGPFGTFILFFFPLLWFQAKRYETPVVVTVHEVLNADLVAPPLVPLKRLYIRLLNEIVAATATTLVFLSPQAEQRFVDSVGSVASKCLPHGVDTDTRVDVTPATARERLGVIDHGEAADSTPVVVTPGYVSPRKGADLILSVAKACPDVEFLVAGGPPRARHTDFFDRIVDCAPSNVTVTGRLSDEEFQLAFIAGDVAVLPYRETEQSGVVNAVNQSGVFNWCAAYGLPVVASDCARFREVASEWDAVRLADATDSTAFGEAIQDLLSDADARTALSDAIEAYAEANSVERVAEHHRELYQTVVG